MSTRKILGVVVFLAFFSGISVAQSCHWENCGLLASHAKLYKLKKSKSNAVVGLSEIAYRRWGTPETRHHQIRLSKQRDIEELNDPKTCDTYYFLCDIHFDLDVSIERFDAQTHGHSSLLSGIEEATRDIQNQALGDDIQAEPNEASVRAAINELLSQKTKTSREDRSRALTALQKANPTKAGTSEQSTDFSSIHKKWSKARQTWDKANQALEVARAYELRADQIAICHEEGCVRIGPLLFRRYLGGEEHLVLPYCPEHVETAEASASQQSTLLFGVLAGVIVIGSILCGLVTKIFGG